LDLTGLLDSIIGATSGIDFGWKNVAVRGREQEGRISFENGIAEASAAFESALASGDPRIIILAEYTFISQELHFCGEADRETLASLNTAVRSFDDAFLCLTAVENAEGYRVADLTWPHSRQYRVQGLPKDAFHIACTAHRTRLRNMLRTPGVDPIEKATLTRRLANMAAAQTGYSLRQEKALSA